MFMLSDAVTQYVQEVIDQLAGRQAREHGYRPALERLMRSYEDVGATNDPKRSDYGNPDMIFYKKSNHDLILGYAEAKDITVDLDKTVKTEQLRRYAGYNKLFLTNYLDFRFYRNGEEYERISLGKLNGQIVQPDTTQFARLANELKAFLELPPEPIKNGKSLALIMGAKAQRIRDNVSRYLAEKNDKNQELEKIYIMMKELLVHDLTEEKFADMYAQTLVYGLFAARYADKTPDNFSRSEARDLVPRSNPFLRKFFDHIAGSEFDNRLAHIVDELCAVFAVSNVSLLVQKHLRLFEVENDKDPIIHFYEDFLKEYDPAVRKKMGAYYTPVPVVKFMVRQVDEILKRDFKLPKGLADTSKITKEIEHGQQLQIRSAKTGRLEKTTIERKEFHRVQVLDPAVGTATFLNETIKYIYESQKFRGQQGQWPAYVNEHLLPRLSGFELMMAPYTIAHLKLGMTLQETGVKDLDQRLGVYLTNTLEEGIPRQQDLFSIGLAAAVTEESQKASEIKHERPIMIVMGNPPYSVSSNNKSDYIQELIKDYKKDLHERNIQPLSDDYIKFIRFAEDVVAKNGGGIVAMITNNSYLDGSIHRQMRKHLLETFDMIYVLDLHGNAKKKETAPGGSKDENVFDIMQGVSIVLMIKTGIKSPSERGAVHHAEIFGTRKEKFRLLSEDVVFTKLSLSAPNYYFVPKDFSSQKEYDGFILLEELFIVKSTGVTTHRDAFVIGLNTNEVVERMKGFFDSENCLEYLDNHKVSSDGWEPAKAQRRGFDQEQVSSISYKPFDVRKIYYSDNFVTRSRRTTIDI